MHDLMSFVQFPHPGREPSVRDEWVCWNTSASHTRKCLRSNGRWRTSANAGAVEREGDVVFWGEWEPPSRVQATQNAPNSNGPKGIHSPYWHEAPKKGRFHNTDPYVFGRCFRYSNCRQNTKNGPRATQNLAAGSLILFGSPVNGEFAVDTVFVTARAQPISRSALSKLHGVDKVFRASVLDLFYRAKGDRSRYRLYDGATPRAPVNGMFSFFPGLPFNKAPNGFARPAIELDDLINPACKQNFKLREITSAREMKTIWRRVVRQVLDAGLYLGVHADTPPRVPASYPGPEIIDVPGGCGKKSPC